MASGLDDDDDDDDAAGVLGVAAAPLGGVAKDDVNEGDGAGTGEPRGDDDAEVTSASASASAEPVAPSADAALGFAARVSLVTGPAPR